MGKTGVRETGRKHRGTGVLFEMPGAISFQKVYSTRPGYINAANKGLKGPRSGKDTLARRVLATILLPPAGLERERSLRITSTREQTRSVYPTEKKP